MRGRLFVFLIAVALGAALTGGQVAAGPADADGQKAIAGGFDFIRTLDPVVCQSFYAGGFSATHFKSGDCIRIDFTLQKAPENPVVKVELIGPGGGAPFKTLPAAATSAGWRVVTKGANSWPAGTITARVIVEGQAAPAGKAAFQFNTLAADIVPDGKAGGEPYAPGEAITGTGNVYQLTSGVNGANTKTGVPATLKVKVVGADGTVAGPYPSGSKITADANGDFAFTIPAGATNPFETGPDGNFIQTVSIEAVKATYTDPSTGEWKGRRAGAVSLKIFTQPDILLLHNSFVSSLGWVKPGQEYPFRITVDNFTSADATGVTVTVPAPDGVRFRTASPLDSGQSATVAGDKKSLTWTIGGLAKAAQGDATSTTLVVKARALRLSEDPQIAWKDISSTATLDYVGYSGPAITSESHGPKVIPPAPEFDTARYGDKPFPMVPVDYRDLKHTDAHTGAALSSVVNDPSTDGSTFNLYQEMSYGQLYPHGTVPSAGIATADFNYGPGFEFTTPEVPGDCRGVTMGAAPPAAYGTALYQERIVDGWYQLPGDTEYYGGDFPAFTLGEAGGNDSACGQGGKAVYDAAQIADPEINYNDYDSDKDGVVDFFMLVFVGCGGNGPSQLAPTGSCSNTTVPYDNIWPHSSSLEMQYKDDATGLTGYVSDDQLFSLDEIPQCWTSAERSVFDDCAAAGTGGDGDDALPVPVRVGPYNVNPETAIDHASVISHEYGHHLGLPDFYDNGKEIYADMNLMAADHGQHMTVFSKQDLGWVVPEFIEPGHTKHVNDWSEIKNDTRKIRWETPDGDPYTLSAANGDQNIHNGKVFGAKLQTRQLIDPLKVKQQTAQPGSNVWYSGRGNDFGCSPNGGHNLDLYLPQLADVPAGTDVTLSFKSSWDIEWDWDYGFVFTTIDGANYLSHASENGYTTLNAYNPNSQACFAEHNNGLTGQSGAYEAGEPIVTASRNPQANDYSNGSPFLDDAYDISDLAGQRDATVRFSYFTDAAFDRPGWFIDDVVVTAGDEVIYQSNFEHGEESGALFPGGCDPDGIATAVKCTNGWTQVESKGRSRLDHAYYMELRDQALFDYDGYGQDERGNTSWDPGVFIEYTDEAHGYGNSGVPWPPSQHYLDSKPQPGVDCLAETNGNCANASFTAAAGDSHFDDHVDASQPEGWVDNFTDPSNEESAEKYGDTNWHFDYNCLSLTVDSMDGEGVGPAPGPTKIGPDLVADATIKGGKGCQPMSYVMAEDNTAPVAVAQAKPRKGKVGDRFTFDGSRSYDDITAPGGLKFAWDFDGDGFDDGRGQTVVHRYTKAGTHRARVRVTDAAGLRSIDGITVEVAAANGGGSGGGGGGGGNEGPGGNGNQQPDDGDDGGVLGEQGEQAPDAMAATGSAALLLFASALLALTAGAWFLLAGGNPRRRRFTVG
jgi:M6 family metalloprotease-like protein